MRKGQNMAKTKQLDAATVAAAVIESRTKKEAAERLAISDRCLYDYMKTHEVRALLSSFRADKMRNTFAALDDLTVSALDTLRAILDSDESTNAEKMRAASIVLDAGRIARRDLEELDSIAFSNMRNAKYDF